MHHTKMDMIGLYPDKENQRMGKPVVRDSDIDRVKRNLSMPLRNVNQLNNNNTSKYPSIFGSERRCVNSPITELAHNFTELAAHEVSYNNTPKRRLSLASSTGSPTPDINRQQTFLTSSTKSISSDSPDSSCSSIPGSITQPMKLQTAKSKRDPFNYTGFRRHHSLPVGGICNEASPPLGCPVVRQNLISPLAQNQQLPSFYVGNTDETSLDSHDSGIGKEERFSFVAPPGRVQQVNESSPIESVVIKKGEHVVGSSELHDSDAQDFTDSPLLAHRLCSQTAEEEKDDGFDDLDDLEKECSEQDIPASIANMLTAKMKTSSSSEFIPRRIPPRNNFRGTLFRSPSMPQQLCDGGTGYDIRRRVLCGSKRSDPPNDDNNTPMAVSKKRRSVLSDGNILPVPCKPSDQLTLSATRLLRCRSMVESSVHFQQIKNDTEGQTGDCKKCCLPLIQGKNADLNTISHETMARVLDNEFDDTLASYTVIDCRYPYEYKGGHIKGAANIYTKEDIYSKYISNYTAHMNTTDYKRNILIFHCEFSSERAPKLSRFLRNHDRETNAEHYPSLYHPELYILESGYKVFYEHHKELCDPCSYKPMLHPEHSDDLKTFRAKSKSWAGEEKRGGFRPGMSRKF